MKYLIFDAGPVISLAMNGMLPVIEKLRGVFDGEFVITPQVKNEIIDRPLKIKKFKLEAVQVRDLLDRGCFKMSTDIIPQQKLDIETKRLLKVANGVFRTTQSGEKIEVIHEGEASCLAFSKLCGADNVIVIDERSTRMLSESPKNLERMMEKKLHTPLDAQQSLLDSLKDFKFIRSAELLFVAYKKGLIPIKKNKDLLDALLYGVKFKGAAISSKEIEDMKKLA
jgi:predicted nucleic acid-binding protein